TFETAHGRSVSSGCNLFPATGMGDQGSVFLPSSRRRLQELFGASPQHISSKPFETSSVAIGCDAYVEPYPELVADDQRPLSHETWVAAGLDVARRLQCSHGGWVLTRCTEAGERAAVVQLLVYKADCAPISSPAPAAQTAYTSSASIGAAGRPQVVLAPLLAYNLGLPYTVQPFLDPPPEDTAPAPQVTPPTATAAIQPKSCFPNGPNAPPQPPRLLVLQLTQPLQLQSLTSALDDAALYSSSAVPRFRLDAVRQRPGTTAAPGAGSPTADAVQLCKVGVPRTAPLASAAAGALGPNGSSNKNGGSGSGGAGGGGPDKVAPGGGGGTGAGFPAAAAGVAEDEGGEDGPASAPSSSGVRDAMAGSLQRFFQQRDRYVTPGDMLAVPLLPSHLCGPASAPAAAGAAAAAAPAPATQGSLASRHSTTGSGSGGGSGNASRPRLVYFKVTEVRQGQQTCGTATPAAGAAGAAGGTSSSSTPSSSSSPSSPPRLPLLVSPASTRLALQGGLCRAPLPVGCEAHPHPQPHPHRMPAPPCSSAPSLAPPPLPLLGCDPAAPLCGLLLPPPSCSSVSTSASTGGMQQQGGQQGGQQAEVQLGPGLVGTPGPLLPAWRSVAQLLAPLLHPATLHLDLPPVTLLLYGPPGSGRRTAVRAAAAALGLHLVPVSCHELAPLERQQQQQQGGAEGGPGGVAGGLAGVLGAAERFAPALVLLQDLEALVGTRSAADSASPAAAAGGSGGAASAAQRCAEVLREA
ncbi:hypothetical protein Agub_g5780, partial [Astrephomene gubernaculifera]